MSELPFSEEAERDLLGMLLLADEETTEDIFLELEPEDFYVQAYRTIFEAGLLLWKNKRPVDFVTVSELLSKNGKLEQVGGYKVLSGITSDCYSTALYRSRIAIIKSNSAARKAIAVAGRLAAGVAENPANAIETAIREMTEISGQRRTVLERVDKPALDTMNYLADLRSGKVEVDGVASPYKKLNYVLQNFRCGDTTVIAARPGMGKSAFVSEIILNAAINDKKKIALFSLEMNKRALLTRMYANLLNSSLYDLSSWDVKKAPDLKPAYEKLKAAEMYVNDETNSLEGIMQACRVQKKQAGLDLVCVDYIGLMTTQSRQKDRRLEIEHMSRQMKLLAQELNIPIILLCQMNRAIEYSDREPALCDLRESGAIEQDASQVIFLHRNKKKEEQFDYRVDIDRFIEVIVAKNRNGAIGKTWMKFEADKMRFIELDNEGHVLKEESKAMTIADLEPVPAGTFDPFGEYVEDNEDDVLFGVKKACTSKRN